MKTGSQSNVFDYDTGAWNDSQPIKPDFRVEKPAFSAIATSLKGETFEQQLVRLGKIGHFGHSEDAHSPERSDSEPTGA